jgi:hypothetical protein
MLKVAIIENCGVEQGHDMDMDLFPDGETFLNY